MFIGLLLSCKDEAKQAVLDMNDIIPQSSEDYKIDSLKDEIESNNVYLKLFNQYGFEYSLVEPFEKRMFPDRFGPDTSMFYTLVDDLDTIVYHKWVYSDSVKVMNSFYNWIDCFGENCKSYHIGEEKNLDKKALMLLVSDSSMIYIQSNSIAYDDWYSFHDSLGYDNDWNFAIEQKSRGRAKWFTFIDKKKTKYESK